MLFILSLFSGQKTRIFGIRPGGGKLGGTRRRFILAPVLWLAFGQFHLRIFARESPQHCSAVYSRRLRRVNIEQRRRERGQIMSDGVICARFGLNIVRGA